MSSLLRFRSAQAEPAAVKKLWIVVPAFNEEGNVGKVVQEVQDLRMPGCKVEMIVIDDGSADRTREVALGWGAKVISLPYNLGIGISVQTGFRYAIERSADFVAQVDGDCQHVPSELQALLAPILEGKADVVIGSRFKLDSTEGIRSTTRLRWLIGRALSFNVWLLTGVRVTDTTSGFRLYNRAAAAYVAENYPDDYPEVQILVPLVRHGFRVMEVPVRMRPRMAGKSSINWYRSLYYVFKVVLSSLFDRVR
ncbi:MAG: glycosyltransferase family 2 protein [Oligoflexia bacterium]|nr:glycosyltransferase family 2 protein [Oligoflexia bacterium]